MRDHCYLGLTNEVESATLSATSEATDHEVELVQTWTTFDTWASSGAGGDTITIDLGSAKAIDAWGLAGHNLDVAGDVDVESSTDNVTWTPRASYTATDTRSVFRVLSAPVTARYWRFIFEGAAQVYVGHVYLGAALQLPKAPDPDFTPPYWDDDDEVMNNQTEGGAFLGRSLIRRGGKTDATWSFVEATWVRTNWRAVLDHVRLNPFYFAWAADGDATHEIEAALCWTDGRQKGPVFHNQWYATIQLSVQTL